MASDHVTYSLIHDFFQGPWLGKVSPPSGKLALLPSPLYAGDSFELVITCYEFYSDTAPVLCKFPAAPISKTIKNAAAVDKGGGLVGIPITAHTFTAGRTVVIAGSTNYNGTYVIISQTTDEIVITKTYSAETFAGTETAVQQGATATLYAKRYNTDESPTTIDTGTISVSGSDRAVLTFMIHKDDLPASLAGSSQLLLFAQVVDPSVGDEYQATIQQTLYLFDHDGDESSNPTAGQMPYTPAVAANWVATAPDDVAEALDDMAARPMPWAHVHKTTTAAITAVPGRQIVHASTALGAYVLTLPAANAYAGQEYVIQNSGHAVLTITPAGSDTINSEAASITTLDRVTLFTDGTSNWYAK